MPVGAGLRSLLLGYELHNCSSRTQHGSPRRCAPRDDGKESRVTGTGYPHHVLSLRGPKARGNPVGTLHELPRRIDRHGGGWPPPAPRDDGEKSRVAGTGHPHHALSLRGPKARGNPLSDTMTNADQVRYSALIRTYSWDRSVVHSVSLCWPRPSSMRMVISSWAITRAPCSSV